jgi:single-strand DNA-binding protein
MENLAIVIGNLGSDPKLHHSNGGPTVTSFSVATNENWTDKQSGEKKKSTEWHQIEAWGDLGKSCAEHLKRGSAVFVKGKMRTTSWEPSPGVKSFKTVIRAKKVKFL